MNYNFQSREIGQLGTIGEPVQAPATLIQGSDTCATMVTCHALAFTLKQDPASVSI